MPGGYIMHAPVHGTKVEDSSVSMTIMVLNLAIRDAIAAILAVSITAQTGSPSFILVQ
jgi:hypothetical protein